MLLVRSISASFRASFRDRIDLQRLLQTYGCATYRAARDGHAQEKTVDDPSAKV